MRGRRNPAYSFRPALIGHLRDRGVRWSARSGLFFVISFLAVARFSGLAYAQTRGLIGLGASSEHVWQALHNRLGLDVRDEQGREVSAALIEAQLKNQAADLASISALGSRLPEARVVFRLLEFWSRALAGLSPRGPRLPASGFNRCPGIVPRKDQEIFSRLMLRADKPSSDGKLARIFLPASDDCPACRSRPVLRC